MKAISFDNQSAQRVYNDYIQRCRRATSILSVKDREDVLLEINSHIYEYLSANGTKDEMETLLNVLERLGAPEETLKEIVASKKIGQATLTFNPKHLIQALALNLTNGVIYIVLFVLFLFEIAFPVLIVMKIMYPDRVGLYTKGNGGFLYGYVSQAGSGGISVGFSNHAERTEILGSWFIPVTLLVGLLIYTGIILLLKIVKKNKMK
jgi:HAAS domain-containing protein